MVYTLVYTCKPGCSRGKAELGGRARGATILDTFIYKTAMKNIFKASVNQSSEGRAQGGGGEGKNDIQNEIIRNKDLVKEINSFHSNGSMWINSVTRIWGGAKLGERSSGACGLIVVRNDLLKEIDSFSFKRVHVD